MVNRGEHFLVIGSNIPALTAQRQLEINQSRMKAATERLASGHRIVRSADDAAGLAISSLQNAHIRSLAQNSRNAQDAISLVQVGEGALSGISENLTRLRELSIQAASDTVGDTERSFIDMEAQQLKDEIERVSRLTEFNGRKIFNGEDKELSFQINLKRDPSEIQVNLRELAQDTLSLGIDDVSMRSKEKAQLNLEKIDYAISTVSENRATLGALQNRFQSAVNSISFYRENLSAARSRIIDADVAEETSEQVKESILSQATISTLAQANQAPAQALKLLD